MDIGEQDVDRRARRQAAQRVAGVADRLHLEALLLQRLDGDIANLRLVFDQQHPRPPLRGSHIVHDTSPPFAAPQPAPPLAHPNAQPAIMVWMLRKVEQIVAKARLMRPQTLPTLNDDDWR